MRRLVLVVMIVTTLLPAKVNKLQELNMRSDEEIIKMILDPRDYQKFNGYLPSLSKDICWSGNGSIGSQIFPICRDGEARFVLPNNDGATNYTVVAFNISEKYKETFEIVNLNWLTTKLTWCPSGITPVIGGCLWNDRQKKEFTFENDRKVNEKLGVNELGKVVEIINLRSQYQNPSYPVYLPSISFFTEKAKADLQKYEYYIVLPVIDVLEVDFLEVEYLNKNGETGIAQCTPEQYENGECTWKLEEEPAWFKELKEMLVKLFDIVIVVGIVLIAWKIVKKLFKIRAWRKRRKEKKRLKKQMKAIKKQKKEVKEALVDVANQAEQEGAKE